MPPLDRRSLLQLVPAALLALRGRGGGAPAPPRSWAGVKVAQDVGGAETTAEARDFETDPEALERVRTFCSRYLPKALGPELYTKTCLYALTPDRDFVLDALPGAGPVWVAIGAGHAFKFASVLGRVLADLALDGSSDADLSLFSIDRPILSEADPPKHFMV